jgi:alkylation response protein AidB-like acyl-CoA dehydrogenase
MRGTGSNTIVTNDVFVPARRTVRVLDLRDGQGEGGTLNDSVIFRAPFASYAPLTFAAPMLGCAQGAYDQFRGWIGDRKGFGGASIADTTSVQVRLARIAADLDAAELLLRRAVDAAQAETPPTRALRARSMRDCSRAAELAVSAIDTLFAMSGTAGFSTSHPIQRAWRDIHFSARHASLNSENNYSHFGRIALGIMRDPIHPIF